MKIIKTQKGPSWLQTLLHLNPGSALKGTHTVYFSSSLYIINQPMIPRTHFHCKTT